MEGTSGVEWNEEEELYKGSDNIWQTLYQVSFFLCYLPTILIEIIRLIQTSTSTNTMYFQTETSCEKLLKEYMPQVQGLLLMLTLYLVLYKSHKGEGGWRHFYKPVDENNTPTTTAKKRLRITVRAKFNLNALLVRITELKA